MDFLSFGCLRKRNGKKNLTWRIFSFKELQCATNNFNYDNKLGEGESGTLYWGQLWNGSQIAVKRFNKVEREREFAVEIEILARVQHKNLVRFRGYGAEGQERLIVYDYMPGSNLMSRLHGQKSTKSLLDWSKRMTIAIGSAEGIAYLHHHAAPRIIHRDIKPSSILLDSDLNPSLAGFGNAKLIPDGATHVTTRVKGTLGYLAPEYAMLGKASTCCDIYSFGILLLELASGKKAVEDMSTTTNHSITDWILPLAHQRKFSEIADPKLKGNYIKEELKRVIILALMCTHGRPEKRPTIFEVVELLKGESEDNLPVIEKDKLFDAPEAMVNSSHNFVST